MSYKLTAEQTRELTETFDWNPLACLANNDVGLNPLDLQAELAVVEGQNNGPSWYWILAMRDGRFAALTGWCDYTGWDCQSGAGVEFFDTAAAAAQSFEGEAQVASYWDGQWQPVENVGQELLSQLEQGRRETWREQAGRELGLG